jgi:pimeloyl-ACP methyl ester carboxylesterase
MTRTAVFLLALCACGDGAAPPADAALPDAPPAADAGCQATAPAESMVDVGEVSLHVVRRGCGPRMLLLHGFPEFSFSWDRMVDTLAASHEVVTVDQRGYAPSEIPPDVAAYEVARLDADIAGLIAALGPEPVLLVAHDWGGAIAWVVANRHPELVRALVIINAPHPDVFAREVTTNPDQETASAYVNFFLSPTAEGVLSSNDYQPLIDGFDGLLTPDEDAQYRAAWAAPGTLTGGLNWYRANIVSGPGPGPSFPTNVTVSVPTLVLWGTMDRFLLPGNLVGLDAYVSDLTIQEFPDSGHWVTYSEPDALTAAILAWAATL